MIGDQHAAAGLYNPVIKSSLTEAKSKIEAAFKRDAESLNCAFSPIKWIETVCDQGPIVIGEATITAMLPKSTKILHQLHPKELEALRAATRRGYRAAGMSGILSDKECDDIIDNLAPSVLEKMLAQKVQQ